MQLGNFHIGFAETAQPPQITSSEVHQLWDNLVIRYDLIELTQLYLNYVHDPDLKLIFEKDLVDILEKQANFFEDELSKYQILLPERPPKSMGTHSQSSILTDKYMFQTLLTAFMDFLDLCNRSMRACVVSDDLRKMFIDYFYTKLDFYHFLCKFGKIKGWIEIPPMMPKIKQ